VPCVDGPVLPRPFFTSQVLVGAAINAAHMTAGHNALRGSGPGALDSAVALVGCPDLRIDRICITCCWSFPTFTARWLTGAISFTPRGRRVPCNARLCHHSPGHTRDLVRQRAATSRPLKPDRTLHLSSGAAGARFASLGRLSDRLGKPDPCSRRNSALAARRRGRLCVPRRRQVPDPVRSYVFHEGR